MKLRLSITTPDGTADPVHVETDSERIACGSEASAVVRLADLPKAAAEIRVGETMLLARIDGDVALAVNGEPVTGEAEFRNGSTLTIGPYEALATVQFERAAHKVKNGLAVGITVFLIVAIIVTEGLIVNWLPKRIARSEVFGGELLRQRTLFSMDRVRLMRIAAQLKRDKLEPIQRQALLLYKEEADRMALYLRNNYQEMSLAELKAFDTDLRLLEKQLKQLAAGELIPPQTPLAIKELLHNELKEKEDRP